MHLQGGTAVGKRATALRELHSSLEGYAPLVALLGHTVGATSLQTGARIVGDSARLKVAHTPLLVLGLGAGDRGAKGAMNATSSWDVPLLLYYTDVFQGSDLLDALQDWVEQWRKPPGGIASRVEWAGHQAIDMGPELDPEFLIQQALIRLHIAR